jgi:hypothetical protein
VNEYYIPLAQREDEWEKALEKQAGAKKGDGEEPGFEETVAGVRAEAISKLIDMAAKKAMWVKKMDAIVVEEQRLKDEEDAANQRRELELMGSSETFSRHK